MALAPSGIPAAIGAVLTGFGYALVFPGLGVETVHRPAATSRARDGRLHFETAIGERRLERIARDVMTETLGKRRSRASTRLGVPVCSIWPNS